MKSIFLRLYLALFLSLLAAGIGLDYLYATFELDSEDGDALELLWRSAQENSHPAAVVDGSGSWQPVSELFWPADSLQQLQQKRAVIAHDSLGRTLFYGLDASGSSVYVRLLKSGGSDQRHTLWLLCYYGVIALVVFLWIKPLVRDIDQLQQGVRAAKLPSNDLDLPLRQRSALTPVANAFRELRRRTADLMALQRDIANAVSHDIRTPLSRIRFALAMMQPSDAEPLRTSIQSDIDEIEQLTDEMLQYAQFEHELPVLRLRSIELHDVVQQLIGRYAHQTSVTFENTIPVDARIVFDHTSLNRVLQNLFDNALRYANQRICIRLHVDANENWLTVEDDGPGFSEHENGDLTEAFVRHAEDGSGFGLGLAIVKKILLWHNGSMALDRSPTLGGARIGLRWPCLPAG